MLRRVVGPFRRRAPPPPHFPVGGPVPGEDLVGREAYVERAAARLRDGEHLLLAGPRRIGKTSVILEVLRRLRKRGAITAYIDCFGATDVRGLAERFADAVLEAATGTPRLVAQARTLASGERPAPRLRYEHVELALPVVRERSAQRALEAALDLPRAAAARSRKRVVVALDEFQVLGRLQPRIYEVMRAHFQAQRGVAYAFLGSEEGILEELFSARGHPLYRFAVPLDLTDPTGHRFGIDPAEWWAYLRRKFSAKRLVIGEAEADRILDLTGGHPQDTMQLCAALYHLMRETAARAVTGELVAIAYEQALREMERAFSLHWSELGTQKYLQPIAKRIARGETLYAPDAHGDVPRAEVLRALTALRQRGLVVRIGRGRYEFLEPMFGEHVRRLDEPAAIVSDR